MKLEVYVLGERTFCCNDVKNCKVVSEVFQGMADWRESKVKYNVPQIQSGEETVAVSEWITSNRCLIGFP